MTIKEKLIEILESNGLFRKDADAIITKVMDDEANVAMKGRWNDQATDYPDVVIKVLWVSVRRNGLEYIKQNCPHAWFRPAFEDSAEQETNTL